MSQDVSVIIATCGRPAQLGRCLHALSRQRLPGGVNMEIIVAVDGGDPTGEYTTLERPGGTRLLLLPRRGIGAARNAAIECATGEFILTTNDDTYPEADWVAQHLKGQAARGKPGLVMGLTQWQRWSDPTVFDGLVRDSSMVFFFHQMRAGETYGFRHFWTCNASFPTSLARAVRGFDERLRPYGYEDLEFAYRVEQLDPRGVFFHPAAVNVHDHRLKWRDYCRREACLGRMAACLWEVNPGCFEAMYHRRDAQAMQREFRAWLALDRRDHGAVVAEMRRWVDLPLESVPDWRDLKRTLYRLHLPVKRRCFRAGFVHYFDLRDDAHWLDRLALGHSFP
ncbi:MAG: glycosyltransferase [Phycisphaerae bacterium]|nr:glycosyltransferase [Phycisphaerae bacterium]